MASDAPNATVRLSDLRRAQAADASLENLLTAITGKIQNCARLAVFEYEAGNEGHRDLALAFREIADAERESFRTLLGHLRRHLNEYADELEPAAGPESVADDAAAADPLAEATVVGER